MRKGSAELQRLGPGRSLAIGRSPRRRAPRQGVHQRFEAASDFVGCRAGWEGYRSADVDGDLAKVGKAAVLALHLPDAVKPHRNDGDAKIFCQQADATLEWGHAAILGIVHFTFGKNEHAVAAVDGFASEAEAFAEAGKLRERENIEQQGRDPAIASPPMAAARRWRDRAGS